MATDEVSETFESQGAVKPSLADLRGSVIGTSSDSFEGTEKAIQSLDKESELRSRMDRERRLRLVEQSERLANMKSAMRKANEIIHDEEYRNLEDSLRSDLEEELSRIEQQVLEREESVLKQELMLRLEREEAQLNEMLSLEKDRRVKVSQQEIRDRLRQDMDEEFTRRQAFLSERMEIEAEQAFQRQVRD